ncbi:MAG TPA: sodium:proton antiporter [Fibrobacteria bacterium]|nr:sodium:proton antiporter [Fibrobacteria bacterium]
MNASLSIAYVLPFLGLLLSMAILPLRAPKLWEHKQTWVVAFWSLAFAVPYAFGYGFLSAVHLHLDTFLHDYLPFLILVSTLFVAAGGIYLTGGEPGNPLGNVLLLGMGTILASLVGTTGASMVMIRPVLRSISNRTHQVHTVVFFIFLVSNIGGSLTPIGDPPLFLGFLHGVDFFWPLAHNAGPMAFASVILLGLYFALDTRFWKMERKAHHVDLQRLPLDVRGMGNALVLLGIVATVVGTGLLAKVWSGFSLRIPGQEPIVIGYADLLRDVLLLGWGWVSIRTTPHGVREANEFSWGPVKEVALLFAGIFVTLIPLVQILHAGRDGSLGWLVEAVHTPVRYFWASGILSSFLDNAPTYLLFFNVGGGDATRLMSEVATLAAISCGSVFMGANSYIGNAPNMLVKAVAEENGVKMPSFLGYMAWSVGVLVPLFILVGIIFF